MKIKLIKSDYDSVISTPHAELKEPKKPNIFWRTLMKLVATPDLLATHFKCEKVNMDKVEKGQPCLIFMNHSAFIDLEIVAGIMYPRPFNIVATTDGYVGKNWLMREIGCIPTKKFVPEMKLLKHMKQMLWVKKSSVLMFPEAGYTFDGTKTTLPDTLGKVSKMMGVPVVTVITHGAFLRQPLYNNLNKRQVNVSATMECLFSSEQVKNATAEEIQSAIEERFSFDDFKFQQENKIKIDSENRADYLNRLLYKCPHCLCEGKTRGEGDSISCTACGKSYRLDEYGYLVSENGLFTHVPDWYVWERECVKEELMGGTYNVDIPVEICMAVDTKHIYSVGEGRLTHTLEGIRVLSDDGKIDYLHKPQASYSICSDFNWYEIGDVICVGNRNMILYCFPKCEGDVVTKVRLGVEELYKITMEQKRDK